LTVELHEKGSITTEIEHTTASGEHIIFESNTILQRDARGKVVGYIAVNRDITERKQAEKALQKSEEQYRTLFNTMNEGFCIIKMLFDEHEKPIDYIYTEANQAFDNQTVLKKVIGKRMRELAPDHEEYWFEIYGKVALTGESVRFENRAEALGRWYEVYAYRVGQPEDRKVAVIFNDITKRKNAYDALHESEYRLQSILDGSDNAFYIKDLEGRFILINKHLEELLGIERNKVYGKTDYDFFTPELADSYKVTDSRILETGVPEQLEEVSDLIDGRHTFIANKFPLYDLHGKPYAICGISTDITERKQKDEN
jgi:PAS domain S-box-containing protein